MDGKEIEYSDIAKLLKKVVQSTSPVQPIAFVLFIEALLRLKFPLKFFREGDLVNTRAQLLLIKDQTSEIKQVNETNIIEEQPEKVEEIVNENQSENTEQPLQPAQLKITHN